jgi:hypothetical protein
MNKTILNKVRKILIDKPETRDCDRLLTAHIWFQEADFTNKKMHQLRAFLNLYCQKKLSNADSITRARRKLQEEDKTLRGETWYKRKNLQEVFRQKVINYKYS